MQQKLKKNSSLYSIIFIFSVICRICVKYAHLVHLLHFYLPQGANFQKFYSKGSILPGSACTCREKRSGKEGKHPSTSTSSLVIYLSSTDFACVTILLSTSRLHCLKPHQHYAHSSTIMSIRAIIVTESNKAHISIL